MRLLLLIPVILLSFISGTTLAQTKSEYVGTFTNSTLTQSGLVSMSLTVTLPDSIKGYMNFSELPTQSPLCGAGSYKGRIINSDSLYYSFLSHDTDNSCGFDWSWTFTLKGRFYAGRDSIAGAYAINNSNNETGFFNLKKVAGPTRVGSVGNQYPLIYPNPANGRINIMLPAHLPAATATITNQLGTKVFSRQLSSGKTVLDLELPNGVYFITITSGELRSTSKLVIHH
jgi:hypothetical protein